MAVIYVDSNKTGGSNNGSDWDNAYLSMGSTTGVAAGSEIWVANNHAESISGSINWDWSNGTHDAPISVVSMTPSGTTGGTYLKSTTPGQFDATVSVYDITLSGFVYFHGIGFGVGDDMFLNHPQSVIIFDECFIEMAGTSNSAISVGSGTGMAVRFKNCTFDFTGNAYFLLSAGQLFIEGGSISTYTTQDPHVFSSNIRGTMVYISDFDMSLANPTTSIIDFDNVEPLHFVAERCKLHASATLFNDYAPNHANYAAFLNCDDGTDQYRSEMRTPYGEVTMNNATYRTSPQGADDGVETGLSMKMVANGDSSDDFLAEALRSFPIYGWAATTGSKTFTINGVWDSATNIQNDECWAEFHYLGTSAQAVGTIDVSDRADPGEAGADQGTNADTWTVSPTMTNQNEFELSATVTVNETGPFIGYVYLMGDNGSSRTVFIDPLIEVT